MLRISKLSPRAVLPTRGSTLAAGLDLASAHDLVIHPGERSLVHTDLKIQLPIGTYGRIAARSGLALSKGLIVGAGVIDADFRGNVGALIFNLGDNPVFVRRGDRIAQLIVEKYEPVTVVECLGLDATSRGEAGFGSTGISTD